MHPFITWDHRRLFAHLDVYCAIVDDAFIFLFDRELFQIPTNFSQVAADLEQLRILGSFGDFRHLDSLLLKQKFDFVEL